MIRKEKSPKVLEMVASLMKSFFVKKTARVDLLVGITLVGSGKGAIFLVLDYLRRKGIIKNKLDEVLVPDWLGYWVYNQIQSVAFPTKRFSERTKVLFVYHQYGFPQDMDAIMAFAKQKKLVVVEDCAHAISSSYKERPLGSFGDFAVYSFSKWLPCFALGGVKSSRSDFVAYAEDQIGKTPFGMTFLKDTAKFLYERSAISDWRIPKEYARMFLGMSYAVYEKALKPNSLAKSVLRTQVADEVELRKKRYDYFYGEMKRNGACNNLEKEGITPYVIPISVKTEKIHLLVNALEKIGVEVSVCNFDINRNFLSPKFESRILIPCHSGISDQIFDDMIKAILNV